MQAARIFGTDQAAEPEGILCVFRGIRCAGLGQKDRRPADEPFQEDIQIKRERGEFSSPRYSSRFALSVSSVVE